MNRERQPTTINNEAAALQSPTKPQRTIFADKEEDDDDILTSLPNRFGRLGLFRNNSGLDECVPTDEDITETETELRDTTHHPGSAGLSSPPGSPYRPIVAVEGPSSAANNPVCNVANPDIVGAHQQKPLLPLSELIERLSAVNKDDSKNGKLRRRLRIPSSNPLGLEEITRILAHVNLCEASQTQPRWDLVEGLAYGEKLCGDMGASPPLTEEYEKCSGLEDPRLSNESHNRQLESQNIEEFKDIEEEASSPSFFGESHDGNDTGVMFLSEASLSLHEIWEEESTASGISLDADSQSITSSVTWYEGSMIEEITLPSDDDDEELREILMADAVSDFEGDDSSQEDEKSPCLPQARSDSIQSFGSSYTEELVDSVEFYK